MGCLTVCIQATASGPMRAMYARWRARFKQPMEQLGTLARLGVSRWHDYDLPPLAVMGVGY